MEIGTDGFEVGFEAGTIVVSWERSAYAERVNGTRWDTALDAVARAHGVPSVHATDGPEGTVALVLVGGPWVVREGADGRVEAVASA